MTHAAMESAIEGLIWDITGISYDDGKLMTKNDISQKVDLLKALIERYGLIIHYNRKTTQEMWTAIKELMPLRNLAVHGVWAMLDGKIPVVISFRLPSTLGHVDSQAFEIERLNAMANQCMRIKKHLDDFRKRVLASPPKRHVQHDPA